MDKPIRVNRFEVINHLSDGSGREVIVWQGELFEVTESIQDGGMTLKIFLKDTDDRLNMSRIADASIKHVQLDSKIATAAALFNEYLKWAKDQDLELEQITHIINSFKVDKEHK